MKKVLLALFALIVIFFIGKDIYQTKTKISPKATRIECQTKQVVFERIYDKQGLDKLVDTLAKYKSGFVSIKEQRSKYMPTQLFEHIHSVDIKNYFMSKIDIENYRNKDVVIDILVYENDKLDPGKKTPKSKLYAGYLVFDFYFEGILVYKIQIDFMDLEGKDINEKEDCVVSSLLKLKGKK